MKFRISPSRVIHVAVLLALLGCGSVDYSKIMQQRVVQVLGADYKGYQPFSYPTNNYGLATMYDGDATAAQFICDTWNCLNVAAPPTDANLQMSLNGFAAVGGDGGTISLSDTEQSSLALNVLLPQLYSILNVNGGYSKSNVTETTLTIGQAYPRLLRRLQLIPFLQALPSNDQRLQAYKAGRLSIVVGDVVVKGLSLTIKVNNSAATNLDAKFAPNVPKEASFSNADLSVKFSSSNTGQYSFQVSQPVVLLRLAATQPGAAGQEAGSDDFRGWPKTVIAAPLRRAAP
jgi:hypothetical protein